MKDNYTLLFSFFISLFILSKFVFNNEVSRIKILSLVLVQLIISLQFKKEM